MKENDLTKQVHRRLSHTLQLQIGLRPKIDVVFRSTSSLKMVCSRPSTGFSSLKATQSVLFRKTQVFGVVGGVLAGTTVGSGSIIRSNPSSFVGDGKNTHRDFSREFSRNKTPVQLGYLPDLGGVSTCTPRSAVAGDLRVRVRNIAFTC